MVKPILEESLSELYCNKFPDCLIMADLGCSSGRNAFLVLSQIIDVMIKAAESHKSKQQPPPSLQAFLNDLPGNDFNTLFRSWPSFYSKLRDEKRSKFGGCFVAGAPGSFYSRLFPDNSLHFVHSSYAIMWLSEAPKLLNEGNICIAKTSNPAVYKSYFEQFRGDFRLIPGGRMVLTTMGSIKSDDPLTIWEFVGLKLNDMALEGLIEKEKLDKFNLPYYAATAEEIKRVIEEEESLRLERLEAFKMDWDAYIKKADPELDKKARAAIFASNIRAVGEPILASHFGEAMMDDLFRRFEEDVLHYRDIHNCQYINIVISLSKKV
uniref:Uncharacterized protein n=1 Tax=Manihot esculenta TaxID=3983 RepID=A0A2C9W0I6_MANES